MAWAGSSLLLVALGVALRAAAHTLLHPTLAERVELVTPLTSPVRRRECLWLLEHLGDAYAGSACHETPAAVHLFTFGEQALPGWPTAFVLLVACDALAGLAAVRLVSTYQTRTAEAEGQQLARLCAESRRTLSGMPALARTSTRTLLACHFLNPLAIAACAAESSHVLTSSLVIATACCAQQGRVFLSALCLAAAAYQSLHPAMLVVPAAIMVHEAQGGWAAPLLLVVASGACLAALTHTSWLLSGSGRFADAVYGFTLRVEDQTPNIGLYWYFFTEVFEHFRSFFLVVFQVLGFVFVAPLSLQFRSDGAFLFVALCLYTTLMKPYPSLADVAMLTSLGPMLFHLVPYFRYHLVSTVLFSTAVALCPVVWRDWVHTGAGNANFYFSATLAYNLSLVIFIADVLHAQRRRRHSLLHGEELLAAGGFRQWVLT